MPDSHTERNRGTTRIFDVDWELIDSIDGVFARFIILSREDLRIVRETISLEPSIYFSAGDPIYRPGTHEIVGRKLKSAWNLSSDRLGIESKDINKHLEALCSALEPWRVDIMHWTERYDISFHTYLKGTRVFASDGPFIDASLVQRISAFGAALCCNVMCESEHVVDPSEDAD